MTALLGATVLHEAEGPMFGVEMRRAVLWIGDNLIEVIEPVGPSPFTGWCRCGLRKSPMKWSRSPLV